MKLILTGYKHNSELTLDEFLYLFLGNLNFNHCTERHINDTVEKEYCDLKRYRSLGDITGICQTYFPNVTREKVKETLLGFGDKLCGWWCENIGKRIYEHSDFKRANYQDDDGEWDDEEEMFLGTDEYGDDMNYGTTNDYPDVRQRVEQKLGAIEWNS